VDGVFDESGATLTTRASVTVTGGEAFFGGFSPTVSGNGHYVAFGSSSFDLHPGFSSPTFQVYRHDRLATGGAPVTTIVSFGAIDPGLCRQVSTDSFDPSMNNSGALVAFWSEAANLVPSDCNELADVFVADLSGGGPPPFPMTRVSVGPGGGELSDSSFTPSLSGGGTIIAFANYASNVDPTRPDANVGCVDVFVRDLVAGVTTRESTTIVAQPGFFGGNDDSLRPSLSRNASFVSFWSESTDLVKGDSNGAEDAFLRDLRSFSASTTGGTEIFVFPGAPGSTPPPGVVHVSPNTQFTLVYAPSTAVMADGAVLAWKGATQNAQTIAGGITLVNPTSQDPNAVPQALRCARPDPAANPNPPLLTVHQCTSQAASTVNLQWMGSPLFWWEATSPGLPAGSVFTFQGLQPGAVPGLPSERTNALTLVVF